MKKWYLSKTMWINVIALIAIILQSVTDSMVLDPEIQASILAIVNLVLRLVTKQQLTVK